MRFERSSDRGRGSWQQEPDQQPIAGEVADLAARLRREADRLAARYPATAPASGIVAAAPSCAPVVKVALLTAIAACISTAAFLLPLVRPSTDRPQSGQRLVRADGADGQDIGRGPEAPRPTSPGMAGPAGAVQVLFDPLGGRPSPTFLMHVSDPELEAVLDLWEKDAAETTRLSI